MDNAKFAILKSDISQLSENIADKQDKLVAGTGITIAADGKTISASGGGGAFVVNVTYDEESETATADKTVNEVFEASKSMCVIARCTDGVITYVSHLVGLMGSDDSNYIECQFGVSSDSCIKIIGGSSGGVDEWNVW